MKQRKKRKPILTTITGVILILVVFVDLWLPLIGQFLIVADPLRPADALVPLAGDRSRVHYGVTLFHQGYADWFVVTDMWIDDSTPPFTYANSVTHQAMHQGMPEKRIVVAPGMPKTTYDEALIIRQFAQEQGWLSLIVVTSPFHTRRSRAIVHDVFRNTDINVMVQPVAHHWYQSDTWWKSQNTRQITLSEYLKFGLYIAGYR